MSIFAHKAIVEDRPVTIISAADTNVELDRWYNEQFVNTNEYKNFQEYHLTEPIEHLMEDAFSGFKLPLIVVYHDSEEQRDAFIAGHTNIELIGDMVARDKQADMIAEADYEKNLAEEKADKRTIAELTNTAEEDPWDKTPSANDMSIMSGAPKGITGQSGQGGQEGQIKKTQEELDREANKEGPSVGIIGQHQDAEGNIQITGQVFDNPDKEKIKEQRAKAEKEAEEEKQKIRDAAEAVGLDADDPNTVTALQKDGTVIQQDNRLGIVTTVFTNGTKTVNDATTGAQLDEKGIRKKELEAELREIDPEGENPEEKPEEKEEPEKMAPMGKLQGNHQIDGSDEVEEAEKEEEEEEENDQQIGNINRQNAQPKKEEKVNPEDYYFAICPPGFFCDESETIIGQTTSIVTLPKKEFDAGVNPLEKGGWFTEEELDKFEWEEAHNSVYVMDLNVGDAYRAISQVGAQENGQLLYRMGLDPKDVPIDWPYHYKENGQRKSDHERMMEAFRILEIAREKGIVIEDDEGVIDGKVAGIKKEDLDAEQPDITEQLKDQFNATGVTEDSMKDTELTRGPGKPTKIDDLPEEVEKAIKEGGGFYPNEDDIEIANVTQPYNTFLRVEGKDLYVLPDFTWDAYCECSLVDTVNLHKIKTVSMDGGPNATICMKADPEKDAFAIYKYREEPDTPRVIQL